MAGIKISNLPAVVSCQMTDIFPEVQPATGGTTYKATFTQLATLFNAELDFLPLAGGTMIGGIDMGNNSLTNVPLPSADEDAANKEYVDQIAQGRQCKDPCQAGTTANLTATYNNGASGVGATLTNAGAMAALTIDGYSVAPSDRILVKDQSSSPQNGIYVVTTVGSGAVNWVLTRSTDMDTASEFQYATTLILNGSVNQGRTYTETAAVTTIGTDPVTWVQTGDATGVTSVGTGTGLTGGPITSTGTISFESIAAHSLWANVTAGAAVPTVVPTNTFLQLVGKQVLSVGSGTYTPTAGSKYFIVEGVGSGAAGGSCSATAGQGSAGGGGGGGGYFRKWFDATEMGANASYTVGAGGAAAAAGANPGGNGNATTFNPAGTGVTLTANGGTGGAAGTASAAIQASASGGYAGGSASNGDINITGGYGGDSVSLASGTLAISGMGGNSYFGQQTPELATTSSNNGVSGIGFGSGGSGGAACTANRAGGAGADGLIVVWEFGAV